MISTLNLTIQFGPKPLFENVTIGLEDTDKIGIIGANGSGKTTLLRVIAGAETSDSGRIVRASGKNLAYLSQNPPIKEESTVSIEAKDNLSGVDSIEYQIVKQDEKYDSTKWKKYDESFKLNTKDKYIIYARIIDQAGNVKIINFEKIIQMNE